MFRTLCKSCFLKAGRRLASIPQVTTKLTYSPFRPASRGSTTDDTSRSDPAVADSSADQRTKHRAKRKSLDMSEFPKERIRNFSIIAHVDHGKSTLADRLLEVTGTISTRTDNKQVLDRLQVERERGITVKAQTASMLYDYRGHTYLLNLIDTPGHVDFNYEVSRSLAACQGVLLVVDANSGVQAQTLANFFLAFEAGLKILPVINKIDLKNADPESVIFQLINLFDFDPDEVIKISAKLGTNVEECLHQVIQKIPSPESDLEKPLKMLMFDSWYVKFRGAVSNVAVIDGMVRKGDKVQSANTQQVYEVKEVGILYPDPLPTNQLLAGQVGYLMTGMAVDKAVIGDTIHHVGAPVPALPGYKAAKPLVFAGMYPLSQSEYDSLRRSLEKLCLNDSSVSVERDSSVALGQGWRLGFLGLLHMEVFNQRLEQEYQANVIVTAPSVPYQAHLKDTKANRQQYGPSLHTTIINPTYFPEKHKVEEYLEPMVVGTVITPQQYVGGITELCEGRRGVQREYTLIDDKRVLLRYRMPLSEIIVDFYDSLKSLSSGYASFDYEESGYSAAPLVKVDFLLNGRPVEEVSLIVHRDQARQVALGVCRRLKETVPRQQFAIAVQAAIGSKVLAREDIKAYRKDVTAKLHAADPSRHQKLLRNQKEGKKKLRMIGNIQIPKDTFISILKKT